MALLTGLGVFTSMPEALGHETPTVAPSLGRRPRSPSLPEANRKSTEYRAGRGPLFVNGVKHSDIGQGKINDCYFVAAASAVAQHHPNIIRQAFKQHADGTLSVRLYQPERSEKGFVYKPTFVRMNRRVPVTKATGEPAYAKSPLSGAKGREQWPVLFEKAFAQQNKGYGAIEFGHYTQALEVITGKPSTYVALNPHDTKQLFSQIREASRAGKPMVTGTLGPHEIEAIYKGATPAVRREFQRIPGGPFAEKNGLAPYHAYTVLGVSEEGGKQFVHIRNPWGGYGPGRPKPSALPAVQSKDNGVSKVPIAMFASLFDGLGIAEVSRAPKAKAR